MTTDKDWRDLSAQLSEVGRALPQRKKHDHFAAWAVEAFVAGDRDAAVKSLTGPVGERAVDAVYIDTSARTVTVFQAKLHTGIGRHIEARETLLEFILVNKKLLGRAEDFDRFAASVEPICERLLRDAFARIHDEGYQLTLVYVTTGSVSAPIEREVQDEFVLDSGGRSDLVILQAGSVVALMKDHLEGAAPAVPTLRLELSSPSQVYVNIEERAAELYVVLMTAESVASLYTDERIFLRNIRGFLGADKSINQEVIATLRTSPADFLMLNNGVTLICDEARPDKLNGRDILIVRNPQIVNGQQTTRSIKEAPTSAAHVLVRVIRLPRTAEGVDADLVQRIVTGTNKQNPITPSDLRANDPVQVKLEYAMRSYQYKYDRKRRGKREATRLYGGLFKFYITKFDIAHASAALTEPGLPHRIGKEPLWQHYYETVFPSTRSVATYVSMHWFWKLVARETDQLGASDLKWAVAFAAWEFVSASVEGSQAFISRAERMIGGKEAVPAALSELLQTLVAAGNGVTASHLVRDPEATAYKIWKTKDPYTAFLKVVRPDKRLRAVAAAAALSLVE
jgi:hypothetical protein